MSTIRCWVLAVMLMSTVAPIDAQQAVRSPEQVISANPFGWLLELFNAEYERTVSNSSTAGAGGSFFSTSGEDYVNADLFYRFYPSGTPLEGFAFGVKIGVTKDTYAGPFFGFGFDTNWTRLLGKEDRFYVSAGFGLKRLYGTSESDFDLAYIPTLRLINIGFAF